MTDPSIWRLEHFNNEAVGGRPPQNDSVIRTQRANTMKIECQVVSVRDLTDRKRDEMFSLMGRYFENANRELFEQDLAEKHWVIQFVDQKRGAVCGFSTQMLLKHTIEEREIQAIFSGDTIVDPLYWGNIRLMRGWAQVVLNLMKLHTSSEMYWFLITNSYRTYRYLPLFFREFYPRYESPTPVWASQLIEVFGREKYGRAFDGGKGIVRGDRWQGCRPGPTIAEITKERLSDPHVEYFSLRNPGYTRGDELCCITPVMQHNWTPAAVRVVDSIVDSKATDLPMGTTVQTAF